jgi:hypothetical protein
MIFTTEGAESTETEEKEWVRIKDPEPFSFGTLCALRALCGESSGSSYMLL